MTPEHGVTRYERDPTQGPAYAIAAGAGTIYRNYFAPVEGGVGETRRRQRSDPQLFIRDRMIVWDMTSTKSVGSDSPDQF